MKISPYIAGIDEAGRGALAGPVVAGACVLPCEMFRRRHRFMCWSPHKKIPATDHLIADSKALSPDQREFAFEWIQEYCFIGVGIAEAEIIETQGILAATQIAMHRALEQLQERCSPQSLLVDGCDAFRFPLPHTSIIRGDSLEPAIAAASIAAKVTRDRLMKDYAKTYPIYGFEGHKGYGAETHIAAIRQHGPCPLHRVSFLGRILQQELLLA